jgi:hypothetical protein
MIKLDVRTIKTAAIYPNTAVAIRDSRESHLPEIILPLIDRILLTNLKMK